MQKSRKLRLEKNKSKKNNINKHLLSRNPDSYLRRRRKENKNSQKKSSRKKKRRSLLSGINNLVNRMTTFQFILLLLFLILGISVVYFKFPFSEDNAITTFITDNNPFKDIDCEVEINNPICWPNKVVPKLEKTDGFTNALLIGLDTREGDSGLMNTDTLMVASYNHSDGKTLLISFPRDLYVPYSINGVRSGYYAKVNSIYANGEMRDGYTGMKLLRENIEDWLDLDIHYTAKVNFSTLTDIVDTIGGITIEVNEDNHLNSSKEYYQDIYPYKELSEEYKEKCIRSKNYPKYCVFKFPIGENYLEGEEALIYARMRQYSSDFDRARRQQQVIDAVKDKVMDGEGNILKKAKMAWGIYQSILDEDNVESNLEYNDIMAAALLVNKADLEPVSVVLDPNFGEPGKFMGETRINKDEEGNGGQYVIKIYDPSFAQIRKELDRVRTFPDLYRDEASVVISNRTDEVFPEDSKPSELEKMNPYFDGLYMMTESKHDELSGVRIYVFNNEKQYTANYLKEFFQTDYVTYIEESKDESGTISASPSPTAVPEVKQSRYIEDIKVVVNDLPSPTNNAETNI